MATNPASLLPPNATPLERAFDAAAARVSEVPVPIAELWDPQTCPAELLPWLAWGLSVDRWDSSWSEEQKRGEVAASIALHRAKGTPAAVKAVLASFDELLQLVEWHQMNPRGAPHTHDIVLPMVTAAGEAPGGPRSRAAFVEQVVREVSSAKRLSQHFRAVQHIAAGTTVGLAAVAHVALFGRIDALAAPDHAPVWLNLLQSEDGEPLQDDAGNFLEVN